MISYSIFIVKHIILNILFNSSDLFFIQNNKYYILEKNKLTNIKSKQIIYIFIIHINSSIHY